MANRSSVVGVGDRKEIFKGNINFLGGNKERHFESIDMEERA